MDMVKQLAQELGLREEQVAAAVRLIDEGNTIPFIARYRKEVTGSMEDTALRELEDRLKYLRNLEKRKEEVLSSIGEQGKLTPELAESIAAAQTLAVVEDLYRPYKQKRRTRASVAREKGLEPLAAAIRAQSTLAEPLMLAKDYLDPEKGVESPEAALHGALDILADDISDDADIRGELRRLIQAEGLVVSAAAQKQGEAESGPYAMYADFSEAVGRIASHRVLAISRGVKEEDAYNYSAIGCVETAVPGKWGYRCTGMSFLNFPKSLLIAMNDGVDPQSGKKLTDGAGHFTGMTSYDQLSHAWDVVIRDFTRHSAIIENACDMVLEEDVPDILCSALCEDCIGRGLTLKEGGAVYDFISGLQVGIANLADSLAAIKKLVFEEKQLTPAQLWETLQSDFAGEEGERVRQLLIHQAPKYGNDDDYVDKLVVDAYDVYIDEIKKYPNTRFGRGPIGGIRYAGTSSISANVGQGRGTLATPDGRHAGEPLAEGCSPSHAMDTHGPTAVFKSVSKLPTADITGGVLLNQKVTPTLLSREENKTKLIALIRAFFNALHGYHVQYNVVSRETLLDAQVHPEDHRDLIVRVAGYSAFFNVLSRQTQDDIIARTEQTL